MKNSKTELPIIGKKIQKEKYASKKKDMNKRLLKIYIKYSSWRK